MACHHPMAPLFDRSVCNSDADYSLAAGSFTVRGVDPNEKLGAGTAGRAGGSLTVTDGSRFASDVQRQAEADNANAIKMIRRSRPASPMRTAVTIGP